ncbi:hypothetical protein D3C80_1363090 [compost metagenome]
MTELVLAEQAVQLGEFQGRRIVLDEGLPLAALGQPAQPAQLHPADLRQVAVLGQEGLDLAVAGVLQAQGQLVVGQMRLQRVALQGLAVAQVGRRVVLAQGALGFVVEDALLGQGGGGRGLGEQAEAGKQTGNQDKRAGAHGESGTSGVGGMS